MSEPVKNEYCPTCGRYPNETFTFPCPTCHPTPEEGLLLAVRNLYYAAVWHADRPVDEAALWIAVRDAAGFPTGESPKPIEPGSAPAQPEEEEIKLHSSVIHTDLTVRCHGCGATLIWRYHEDKDEIEVFHCANKADPGSAQTAMGNYYEARCGRCDAVLFRTTKGIWVAEINCHRCKAANIFSDSTAQPDGDIRGQVADASGGTAHIPHSATVSD